jgi:hypothetical protein
MLPSRSRLGIAISLALVGAGSSPRDAVAQAWVSPKGEGAVTIAVQNMNVVNHLAATTPVKAGTIDTTSLLIDTTFGLTDRLSFDFAAPFVSSKYSGTKPHPGSNVDNGTYHGTFADLRFAVRYNVTRKGVVFTPYVGTTTPSHDYVYFAHAAAGQRLTEFQLGAYAAKLFDRGVPNLFISGRYSYGFVEKVLDISHNRSSADLEVGYFFTPKFRAFGMTSGQYTHGGLDLPPNGPPGLPLKYQPVHDLIQKVHYLKVGAGVSYSINDSFDVFGSFARQVTGRNGHELNRGISVGASWGFSRRKHTSPDDVVATAAAARKTEGSSARREGSLVRCICQKSSS